MSYLGEMNEISRRYFGCSFLGGKFGQPIAKLPLPAALSRADSLERYVRHLCVAAAAAAYQARGVAVTPYVTWATAEHADARPLCAEEIEHIRVCLVPGYYRAQYGVQYVAWHERTIAAVLEIAARV